MRRRDVQTRPAPAQWPRLATHSNVTTHRVMISRRPARARARAVARARARARAWTQRTCVNFWISTLIESNPQGTRIYL